MESKGKRVTMVKSQVGKVKTPTHDLPPPAFVYGRKSNPDESVGDIISKWVAADPSETKAKPPHYIHKPRNNISNLHPNGVVFGRKTVLSPDPMKSIIQSEYNPFIEDIDYPRAVSKLNDENAGAFPVPRMTISSSLTLKLHQDKKNATPPKPFIMSKFKKVPSRLNLQSSSPKKTSNASPQSKHKDQIIQ